MACEQADDEQAKCDQEQAQFVSNAQKAVSTLLIIEVDQTRQPGGEIEPQETLEAECIESEQRGGNYAGQPDGIADENKMILAGGNHMFSEAFKNEDESAPNASTMRMWPACA